MTPQSPFMVVAPVAPGREAALRALLDSMNTAPGLADPHNALLPFGRFERLHFARLAVLDDPTLADIEAHGLPALRLPTYLAFLGDVDGSAHAFLADLVERAGGGLRRLFNHCEGFTAASDLLAWLLAHDRPLAATYVNWVGRTVQQIRQEHALQRALSARVPRGRLASPTDAQRVRHELIAFAQAEQQAGHLALTPAAPTPLGWLIAQGLHLVAVPLIGVLLLPLVVVLLPLVLVMLRAREVSDPVICPPPDPAALRALQALEDRDVTNQYTALGAVKPGVFRRWLVSGLLVLIDYACRHVFTRGHLARVQTIHFARWVFIDDRARVVFTSHYDGSHQAYMDDFINKVAWGLNLVFSNGIGWPRTDWLILRGARNEPDFKRYQRRHQLPTQVWYKAYPGLVLADMVRNQRIRAGLEAGAMSDAQALAWLKLL